MRLTSNWIGHHGVWPVAPARETKTSTPTADAGVDHADWRDALPFWAGFAVLAVAFVGIDLPIVWASMPH